MLEPAAPATLRMVREDDVPAVVDLVRETLAEFALRFGEGSTTDAELLGLPSSYDARGGAFWVAVDGGGSVVGTCGLFPVGSGDYELRKMYLRPASRGKGLGQRLLDASVAWARSQGAARIVLDTTEQMTRAIAFYEANGFVRDDAHRRGARCSRGYVRELGRPHGG
jgi:putative acetyltransferase